MSRRSGAPLTMPASSPNPIILYDGVCGLCNRFIQLVLERDINNRFRFASLQSECAEKILYKHGVQVRDLDTLYVVRDFGQSNESLVSRSEASTVVLSELGGIWRALGMASLMMPRWLRDWSYGVVAKNRYRIFGKYDHCLLPEERYRHKFLDM